MRSNEVNVNIKDIAPALDMIERTSAYIGFDWAYSSKLRLLGEELITSASHVLDELKGVLWMDTDDANMYIHLKIEGRLSEAKRAQLVDISKSGKNEKPKGLKNRMSAFFDDVFMMDAEGYVPILFDDDMLMGHHASFSMLTPIYADTSYKSKPDPIPDELEGIEKTILKKLADDILVSARGSSAEMTVVKKLP